MAERIQQTKTVSNDGVATQTTKTVTDDGMAEEPTSWTAARVIWFVAGVIIALLGLRFILVLLGANEGNAFVNLIYDLSYPFAAPFFGIFSYELEYGVSRFELSTLFAMAIYALIAWGLEKLVTIRRPAA